MNDSRPSTLVSVGSPTMTAPDTPETTPAPVSYDRLHPLVTDVTASRGFARDSARARDTLERYIQRTVLETSIRLTFESTTGGMQAGHTWGSEDGCFADARWLGSDDLDIGVDDIVDTFSDAVTDLDLTDYEIRPDVQDGVHQYHVFARATTSVVAPHGVWSDGPLPPASVARVVIRAEAVVSETDATVDMTIFIVIPTDSSSE